jgi:hypothetical protein
MAHTFRHNEALSRRKIDNAIFKIDQEVSVEDKKEFIDVFMFVPMIFALNRSPCKASGCTICRCRHRPVSAHRLVQAAHVKR